MVFFNRQPMAIKAAPMKKLTEMVQLKDVVKEDEFIWEMGY